MAKWATNNPPKKRGRYLITINGVVRQADRSEYPKGNWYWSILPSGSVCDNDVVAWQKYPEPYKE